MSKILRSPPSTPNVLTQSQSDPNITVLDASDEGRINKNPRNKRPRCEKSPVNDLHDFKQELKQEIEAMFASWNGIQTRELSKMLQQQQSIILDNLMSEVNEIKTQNSELKRSFLEVEKSVKFISSQYEDVTKKVLDLELENNYLTEQVKSLENTVRDIQMGSRSSTIEIRNVPVKDNETFDDLVSILTEIGNKIEYSVTLSDLRDVRRVSGKPGLPKPILAEFTKVVTKRDFISGIRKFNKNAKDKQNKLNTELIGVSGARTPIYVSELLSLQIKKLLFRTQEFAKANGYDYCWTSNGAVYLRRKEGEKQIIVKSEQTLTDLLKTI